MLIGRKVALPRLLFFKYLTASLASSSLSQTICDTLLIKDTSSASEYFSSNSSNLPSTPCIPVSLGLLSTFFTLYGSDELFSKEFTI